ncbi:transcription termination factor 4, mitochondrial [Denticeps clupeoides]|uniref:Mitochondrial transcription termination factor 4 n=2 Tax=Denticeps clupeoides TaxID=299321 RepID=A0AAY4AN57_9TELE|nr:transcription termination factor 4, mitochondrial-like [Denticeps clupeoides]XP_028833442.1 transcription termination factor 4, mitochondrial-like [Denticeps clupeoides]
MGFLSCCRQVFRWSLRATTFFPFPPHGRHNTRHLVIHREFFSAHVPHSAPQLDRQLYTAHRCSGQLDLHSLLEMGFTETQAEHLYSTFNTTQSKMGTSVLTALMVLGLNHSTIVKILDRNPALYSLKGDQVQQRIENLWKLGLIEGSIQRVVSFYPQILNVPVKKVNALSHFLRDKCVFTAQQVTDILRDTPEIVEHNVGDLEYKVQYAYFRMGAKQADMVKAKLFRVSLDELRSRHCFLEHRGLYQTPNKKGQTLIINPKLKDFLGVPEEMFLTEVAKATKEEFDIFCRERKEAETEDPQYSEGEEEDDKGNLGQIGYNRRRKR